MLQRAVCCKELSFLLKWLLQTADNLEKECLAMVRGLGSLKKMKDGRGLYNTDVFMAI